MPLLAGKWFRWKNTWSSSQCLKGPQYIFKGEWKCYKLSNWILRTGRFCEKHDVMLAETFIASSLIFPYFDPTYSMLDFQCFLIHWPHLVWSFLSQLSMTLYIFCGRSLFNTTKPRGITGFIVQLRVTLPLDHFYWCKCTVIVVILPKHKPNITDFLNPAMWALWRVLGEIKVVWLCKGTCVSGAGVLSARGPLLRDRSQHVHVAAVTWTYMS